MDKNDINYLDTGFYGRFSTDDQNPKSSNDQLAECIEYVEKKGGRIAKVYKDDGYTGTNAFRPEFQRLIKDVSEGKFSTLIVENLDRLARNEGDLFKLYDLLEFHDVRLVSLNDGETISRMELMFKGHSGAEEARKTSLKTKRGLKGRVRDGKNPGSCPYGFRPCHDYDPIAQKKVTGILIQVPEEVAVIQRIFQYYAEGWPPNQIAKTLNDEGIPAPQGKHWLGGAVRIILSNRTYIGERVFNRTTTKKDPLTGKLVKRNNPEDEWCSYQDGSLRIIGDNLWKSVQARREDVANQANNKAISNKLTGMRRSRYLLSGLLKCGECGSNYTVASQKRYGCSSFKNKTGCTNGKTITRPVIENKVLDVFKEQLLTEDVLSGAITNYRKHYDECRTEWLEQNSQKEARIKVLTKRIEELLKLAEQGIQLETVGQRIKEYEDERFELKQSMVEIPELNLPDGDVLRDYRQMLDDLSENLDDELLRRKVMNIVRPMVSKITLHPTDDGLRGDLEGALHNIVDIDTTGSSFFNTTESDIERPTIVSSSISDSILIAISLPFWEGNRR